MTINDKRHERGAGSASLVRLLPYDLDPLGIVGRGVTSARRIEQSPLSDDPPVPRGTAGNVEDWDSCADLYAVDFGDPYGVVLCAIEDIRAAVAVRDFAWCRAEQQRRERAAKDGAT